MPEPATITPLRSKPAPEAAADAAPVVDGSFDIEQIADLWPNVRADVKALNRRIEALLSEVDPVAISGNQVTLAVPYPFHRDKLNSDDVRETVGGVLSRLVGRNHIARLHLAQRDGDGECAIESRSGSGAVHNPTGRRTERR